MKSPILEFRMFIAEWLLGICFDIAPKNKDGQLLKTFIGHYFQFKVINK